MATDLRSITTFKHLVRFLEDELGWPIRGYDVAELTFDYEAEEVGLKPEEAAKVRSIKQLRPLTAGQPWGIFFVEFDRRRLPVAVLRRILSHLVIKKRSTAASAERPAWKTDDLLFISAFGAESGSEARELALAHFHQQDDDLPTLRVLGWDGGDTLLKLEHVTGVLKERLHWPTQGESEADWQRRWTSAFRHRPGHVIRTADLLAEELAMLARRIRDAASTLIAHESERGPLRKLHQAFKDALIHDLKPEDFADTYAQTITYGLLTAAISRTDMEAGAQGTALVVSNLTDMVPVTNPFLKEMLQTFLHVGGRRGRLDFDELGVQDVVELLRGEDTDLPAILRDFGNKTRGEDPVIHFYEHFLSAYNKQLKIQRGVFYTPQPVVSYIVRSVHELLQTEFGLADGLAATTTWGEMLKRHPGLKLPPLTDEPGETHTISPDEPFVQILDPATGTATFLVEVIDVIHRTLAAKWKQQRLTDAQQRAAWNDYVPRHLLPRLHAFELMMAPYAIAHMKIGLKLAETGYRFGTEERARIYLTNALEPWVRQLPLIGFDALAHEAAAVNEIKRHKRFTVVIGNPPYSQASGRSQFTHSRVFDRYRAHVADERRSGPLSNDYVRFVATAQGAIELSGCGVFGMITSSSFLESIVHRGMRHELLACFQPIFLLDLHGETLPGRPREVSDTSGPINVFDIQEGVAVTIGVRIINSTEDRFLLHHELHGSRDTKYEALNRNSVRAFPSFRFQPGQHTGFAFTKVGASDAGALTGVSFSKMFRHYTTGITTFRDHFATAFSKAEMRERVVRSVELAGKPSAFAQEFNLQDGRGLEICSFLSALRHRAPNDKEIFGYVVSPFDHRVIWFRTDMLGAPRAEVAVHMLRRNVAMLTTRQTKESFGVLATRLLPGHKCIAKYDGSYFAPLHLHDATDQDGLFSAGVQPHNFSILFVDELARVLGLHSSAGAIPANLTPEDIFHYAYAVFHSPGYRSRCAEFLKIDFPRLPLTGNLELFRALARLGGELTALHLLESSKLEKPLTEFLGGRAPEVEKVSWTNNTVWIDKAQTAGFKGVKEEVWNFHIGGYQVCEKWLKDRKGRKLLNDDIEHYHKIVVALSETIRLMAKIDEVIEEHGGWPGAFATASVSSPPPATDEETLPLAAEGEQAQYHAARQSELGIQPEDELPLR